MGSQPSYIARLFVDCPRPGSPQSNHVTCPIAPRGNAINYGSPSWRILARGLPTSDGLLMLTFRQHQQLWVNRIAVEADSSQGSYIFNRRNMDQAAIA
jgi:hypothetical protein